MTALPRILFLLSLLFSSLVLAKDAFAKDVVRVGVLQYGTVNWEMQAIEHLGLQKNIYSGVTCRTSGRKSRRHSQRLAMGCQTKRPWSRIPFRTLLV